MTDAEKKALKEKSQQNAGLYTDEEMRLVAEALARGEFSRGDTQRVQDFVATGEADELHSGFSAFSPVLKGYVATHVWHERLAGLPGAVAGDAPPQNAAAIIYGDGEALNPSLRKALSMSAGGGNAAARAVGDELDRRMMTATMLPPSPAQEDALEAAYDRDEIGLRRQAEYDSLGLPSKLLKRMNDTQSEPATAVEASARAREQGKAMARMMLLMQIGDFQIRQGGQIELYDGNMAGMLAHGGRVAVVLPPEIDPARKDDVFTTLTGEGTGMIPRAASTHAVVNPKAWGRADSVEGFEEQHGMGVGVRGLVGAKSTRDYGMDMAIGGIGHRGVNPGDAILNDGRSGHLYVGYSPGEHDEKGVVLLGLETDAPYRRNQTGHMHDMFATAEENSSTGGYKTDLVGDKYGGRVLDVSRLSTGQVAGLLQAVDRVYDTGTPEQIRELVEGLGGRRMGAEQLANMLGADERERRHFRNDIEQSRMMTNVRENRTQQAEEQARREARRAARRTPERPGLFQRIGSWFSEQADQFNYQRFLGRKAELDREILETHTREAAQIEADAGLTPRQREISTLEMRERLWEGAPGRQGFSERVQLCQVENMDIEQQVFHSRRKTVTHKGEGIGAWLGRLVSGRSSKEARAEAAFTARRVENLPGFSGTDELRLAELRAQENPPAVEIAPPAHERVRVDMAELRGPERETRREAARQPQREQAQPQREEAQRGARR